MSLAPRCCSRRSRRLSSASSDARARAVRWPSRSVTSPTVCGSSAHSLNAEPTLVVDQDEDHLVRPVRPAPARRSASAAARTCPSPSCRRPGRAARRDAGRQRRVRLRQHRAGPRWSVADLATAGHVVRRQPRRCQQVEQPGGVGHLRPRPHPGWRRAGVPGRARTGGPSGRRPRRGRRRRPCPPPLTATVIRDRVPRAGPAPPHPHSTGSRVPVGVQADEVHARPPGRPGAGGRRPGRRRGPLRPVEHDDAPRPVPSPAAGAAASSDRVRTRVVSSATRRCTWSLSGRRSPTRFRGTHRSTPVGCAAGAPSTSSHVRRGIAHSSSSDTSLRRVPAAHLCHEGAGHTDGFVAWSGQAEDADRGERDGHRHPMQVPWRALRVPGSVGDRGLRSDGAGADRRREEVVVDGAALQRRVERGHGRLEQGAWSGAAAGAGPLPSERQRPERLLGRGATGPGRGTCCTPPGWRAPRAGRSASRRRSMTGLIRPNSSMVGLSRTRHITTASTSGRSASAISGKAGRVASYGRRGAVGSRRSPSEGAGVGGGSPRGGPRRRDGRPRARPRRCGTGAWRIPA